MVRRSLAERAAEERCGWRCSVLAWWWPLLAGLGTKAGSLCRCWARRVRCLPGLELRLRLEPPQRRLFQPDDRRRARFVQTQAER